MPNEVPYINTHWHAKPSGKCRLEILSSQKLQHGSSRQDIVEPASQERMITTYSAVSGMLLGAVSLSREAQVAIACLEKPQTLPISTVDFEL